MSKERDVLINVTGDTKELILRTGEAAPVREPQALKLAGTVESVLDFYNKRKDGSIADRFPAIGPHNSYVAINRVGLTVTLVVTDREHNPIEVSGKMIENPIIKELGINGTKAWTNLQLRQALKLKRSIFESRDDLAALLNNLEQFKVNTDIEFENSNSFQGDVAYKKIISAKANLKLEFFLNIPIYEGESKRVVKIDFELQPADGSVVMFLVSPDLAEAMDNTRDEVLDRVAGELAALPIIRQ